MKCTIKKKKTKTKNKTNGRCQVGNKVMKTKLRNLLRQKKRNKKQIGKVKKRQMKKIYIH